MFAGKCKLHSPQDCYRVTKVANEIYLPYLQICGKAFFNEFSCIAGVKVAQSYEKRKKIRPSSGHKQAIFYKIFC